MTKRFLFTQEIDFPKEEFDSYDRHKYPQQYLQEILQERVPNSHVTIMDDRGVAQHLNQYQERADKDLQEYIANYSFAVNLARKLDVLHAPGMSASEIEMDRYHERRREHMETLRAKFPKTGISLAGECFSYPQPRKISHYTEPKINTDVAGIIVPIGHGDYRDFTDILSGLTGLIKDQFAEIKAEHGSSVKAEDTLASTSVKQQYNFLRHHFYARYGIPVFESWMFAPADRGIVNPVGHNVEWKETEYSFGREEFIKFAFNKWIDTNFPKNS